MRIALLRLPSAATIGSGLVIARPIGGQSRVEPSFVPMAVIAVLLMMTKDSPAIGLWALAAKTPGGGRDLFAPLAALLVGTLAWLAASAAAKSPSVSRSDHALRAGLVLALLAPAMALALVLPIGIAIVERRPAPGLSALAALALAIGGQPVCATLALVAACATLLPPTTPRAANDNGWVRPLPYLP